MTCRSYIKQAGQVVAVEVEGTPDTVAVESELRRVYGQSLRLGRWSRRGKRRRAEVMNDQKLNDIHIQGAAPVIGTMAGKGTPRRMIPAGQDWFGGAP
jgi:hypothetical protein